MTDSTGLNAYSYLSRAGFRNFALDELEVPARFGYLHSLHFWHCRLLLFLIDLSLAVRPFPACRPAPSAGSAQVFFGVCRTFGALLRGLVISASKILRSFPICLPTVAA